MDRVKRCYDIIKDLSEEQLLELDTSFALTQYLVNIYGLFQNINDIGISSRLVIFSSKNIYKCRNISSHDYDSLNWVLVKKLCSQLLDEKVIQALNDEIQRQNKPISTVPHESTSTTLNEP